jgi:REP element-mobilizing transposase RayT
LRRPAKSCTEGSISTVTRTGTEHLSLCRRDLPHWEDPGATYFVRFSVRRSWPVDLTAPEIARIVIDALRFSDGRRYWLYDYTVMPDHVHVILKPIVRDEKAEYLWSILRDVKGWSARQINKLLGRRGPLWRDESFDHIIRNRADYRESAEYILQNPAVAGLIEDPTEWPWWGKGSGV